MHATPTDLANARCLPDAFRPARKADTYVNDATDAKFFVSYATLSRLINVNLVRVRNDERGHYYETVRGVQF